MNLHTNIQYSTKLTQNCGNIENAQQRKPVGGSVKSAKLSGNTTTDDKLL